MLALTGAAGTAHAAGGMQARVMVLPTDGAAAADAKLAGDVADALTRGARRATPNVARATASLDDTAVIVGCEPAERTCVDAVAAALNVDQMLLARISGDGDATIVLVTAVSRESAPVTQEFPVRAASRREDLAAIEAAVPALLDAEARGGGDPGGGTPPGGGDETPPGGGNETPPGGGSGVVAPPGGDGRGSSPMAPKIITIGGGALVATGLVFWGLAAAKQGAIDDAATSSEDDLRHLEDLEDTGKRYAIAGNVLVIAGGVTAAAGAFWWWRTRDAGEPTVTPVVTPGSAAVVLEGRW